MSGARIPPQYQGPGAAWLERNTEQEISVPIMPTAGGTSYGLIAATRSITIKAIQVACLTVPAGVGTNLNVYHGNATADSSGVSVLSSASDLSGLTAKASKSLSLTSTTSQLTLAAGDTLYATITADSAGLGTGVVATVRYIVN